MFLCKKMRLRLLPKTLREKMILITLVMCVVAPGQIFKKNITPTPFGIFQFADQLKCFCLLDLNHDKMIGKMCDSFASGHFA